VTFTAIRSCPCTPCESARPRSFGRSLALSAHSRAQGPGRPHSSTRSSPPPEGLAVLPDVLGLLQAPGFRGARTASSGGTRTHGFHGVSRRTGYYTLKVPAERAPRHDPPLASKPCRASDCYFTAVRRADPRAASCPLLLRRGPLERLVALDLTSLHLNERLSAAESLPSAMRRCRRNPMFTVARP
jgi:hypothetical protein